MEVKGFNEETEITGICSSKEIYYIEEIVENILPKMDITHVFDSYFDTISVTCEDCTFELQVKPQEINVNGKCNGICKELLDRILEVYGGSYIRNDDDDIVPYERDLRYRISLDLGYCPKNNAKLIVYESEEQRVAVDEIPLNLLGNYTDHSRWYGCNCTFRQTDAYKITDLYGYTEKEIEQLLDFILEQDLSFKCSECV